MEMTLETTLKITGMHCQSCAQRLSQRLERRDGVIKADVDVAGTAKVRYDENRVNAEQLGQVVCTAGFELV
ncbi:copper chaperone [Actinobacteria bacterium YIM 96077]|uniref:HMA domain-containing protein n=1 Tax=Phytoactinopolyspora halophila TaxID=1981511 RepID=A0A329QYX4_9ACTN|nr:heavy-metal-associated domain-containing protein [Phytoactinopolyspora halophila]AYY13135.1 copper chaperone [Actinobacteria bacterium YIM 96077]RAW17624.1 hypothetical protein DPM12_06490 [Phytoactinopolyspora halophila]